MQILSFFFGQVEILSLNMFFFVLIFKPAYVWAGNFFCQEIKLRPVAKANNLYKSMVIES